MRVRDRVLLGGLSVFLAALGSWLLLGPHHAESSPPAATSAPPSPSTPSPAPVTEPAPSTAPNIHVSSPPVAATEQSRENALATASGFVADWLDQGAEGWWSRLEDRMTPAAADVYTVDPAAIPPGHTIAEEPPASIIGDPSEIYCLIEVPTTRGAYEVTLIRARPGSPWLVDRIIPPER